MCIGFDGIEHGNDELYMLLAINNIFGGGMSSRLFQKIREEKGLAYSIYSYPSSYKNTGLFTVYAGMKPEQLEIVVKMVIKEIRQLKSKGIKKEELEKSKEQLKGNYILGLESTSSRMNNIGKAELMLGRINTPDEVLAKIDSINLERVTSTLERVFDLSKVGFTAVGNIKKEIDFNSLL
jgi:predicted Zn-dependent peptidase